MTLPRPVSPSPLEQPHGVHPWPSRCAPGIAFPAVVVPINRGPTRAACPPDGPGYMTGPGGEYFGRKTFPVRDVAGSCLPSRRSTDQPFLCGLPDQFRARHLAGSLPCEELLQSLTDHILKVQIGVDGV